MINPTSLTATRRALALMMAYRSDDRAGMQAVLVETSNDPDPDAGGHLLSALIQVCSQLITTAAGAFGDRLLAQLAESLERQAQAGSN